MEAVWARSSNWELDHPRPGDVLPRDGIRISGTTEAPAESEGVARWAHVSDPSDASSEYVMTGVVVSAIDFQVVLGSGPAPGGTDIVLSVDGERVQAQIEGPASTVDVGARLTVRGEVSLIPVHEWDSFEQLVDTRRRWTIADVRTFPDGEYLLLLRPAG